MSDSQSLLSPPQSLYQVDRGNRSKEPCSRLLLAGSLPWLRPAIQVYSRMREHSAELQQFLLTVPEKPGFIPAAFAASGTTSSPGLLPLEESLGSSDPSRHAVATLCARQFLLRSRAGPAQGFQTTAAAGFRCLSSPLRDGGLPDCRVRAPSSVPNTAT